VNVFDRWGTLETFLVCPECGRSGIVYYKTRRPVYCSDACRQRAYRRRKRQEAEAEQEAENVTPGELAGVTNRTRQEIERQLDMALHLMGCGCPRYIWATRGNVEIGGIRCDRCGEEFRPTEKT